MLLLICHTNIQPMWLFTSDGNGWNNSTGYLPSNAKPRLPALQGPVAHPTHLEGRSPFKHFPPWLLPNHPQVDEGNMCTFRGSPVPLNLDMVQLLQIWEPAGAPHLPQTTVSQLPPVWLLLCPQTPSASSPCLLCGPALCPDLSHLLGPRPASGPLQPLRGWSHHRLPAYFQACGHPCLWPTLASLIQSLRLCASDCSASVVMS